MIRNRPSFVILSEITNFIFSEATKVTMAAMIPQVSRTYRHRLKPKQSTVVTYMHADAGQYYNCSRNIGIFIYSFKISTLLGIFPF